MSIPDEEQTGDEGADQHRRKHRRKQAAVGVAGIAVVLGAGAYLVTTQVVDRNASTETRDADALTPLSSTTPAVATSASAEPTAEADTVGPGKDAVEQTTSPAPSRSQSVDERIKEAREKAAKDGYSVKRPVTQKPGLPTGPVNERQEQLENGSMRVVSAKYDLTGQRELLWAGDRGKRVGDNTCTQSFRFANNVKASVKPNMLLCWRTSADKSVITVLVDQNGKPSREKSADIIAREWAKLG